jgi:hypothetical protein
MNNNGLDDIPEESQDLILEFSNLDNIMKVKLVELWHLFETFHNPLLNHNYKPIDKYVLLDQAEGEFNLYVIQISYITDKITDIDKEIKKYEEAYTK